MGRGDSILVLFRILLIKVHKVCVTRFRQSAGVRAACGGWQTNQAENTFSCHLFACVDQKHVINVIQSQQSSRREQKPTNSEKTGSSRAVLDCSSSVGRQASVNTRLGFQLDSSEISSRVTLNQRACVGHAPSIFPI